MSKYQVWATAENGEGRVQSLGVYDDPTDIVIPIRMFAPDVIINIEEYIDENETSKN